MTSHQRSQPDPWTIRRVVWGTLVLVFVVLAFWLLYRFYQVLFVLFIAIVIGTVIRPVVGWLNRRGIPRRAGVILIYLLLLALLIGFLLMVFPLIIAQTVTIAAALPGYYQGFREWMLGLSDQWMVRLGEFLPAVLPGLEGVQPTGQQTLVSTGQILGYMESAASLVFLTASILLLAFHWTLEGPRTIQSLLLLVPSGRRESISELVSAMETKVSSVIGGQGLLCLIIGGMALVAYWIIGLPNALVLALVACVMEVIPMIGPLLGAIPAAIIAFSMGPSAVVWVIIATLVIHQLENYLLVPRIMNKAVGVNPFVSLLAFFAFSSLLGIPGALMAIPMAAIISLLLDRFVFHPAAMESETSAGRNSASRLRYEVQELAQGLRRQARLNPRGSDLRITQIDLVMDEIEAITTDLDSLLAKNPTPGAP